MVKILCLSPDSYVEVIPLQIYRAKPEPGWTPGSRGAIIIQVGDVKVAISKGDAIQIIRVLASEIE